VNQFTVSVWGDEAFSAVLSQKSVPQIISIIIRDTSPPLYNLTEHFWFKLFGNSEVAIRALSFLYFLIAVLFVYKIGSYLWNKNAGLIAALLTFLNPFFFIYAFEGRMYSLLAATVTASFYFFLSKKWKWYVVATTLALYTHHFAIFAVFTQGLWFLKEFFFGKRKVAYSILKSFALVAVLYSPWILPLYGQTKMVGGGFWLGTPTLVDLRNLIYNYLAEGIKHRLAQPALYLAFAIVILRRWLADKEKSLVLLSWFFVPIVLTWVVSQKFQSIFFDRYLLYTIPAAMLLLGSNLRRYSYIFLTPLILFFVIMDVFYFTHPTKLPFRDLATYVREVQKGDDYLINWNSASHHLWESKYYGLSAPLYNPGKALPFFVGTALMTKDDVVSSIPKKVDSHTVARVGVITSGSIDETSLPGYTRGEAKTFSDLKFVWFDKI